MAFKETVLLPTKLRTMDIGQRPITKDHILRWAKFYSIGSIHVVSGSAHPVTRRKRSGKTLMSINQNIGWSLTQPVSCRTKCPTSKLINLTPIVIYLQVNFMLNEKSHTGIFTAAWIYLLLCLMLWGIFFNSIQKFEKMIAVKQNENFDQIDS